MHTHNRHRARYGQGPSLLWRPGCGAESHQGGPGITGEGGEGDPVSGHAAVTLPVCAQQVGEGRLVPLCVDVADIEATRREVEGAGPIHLLVNNAGVTELQPFLDVTVDAYDKYVCYNEL